MYANLPVKCAESNADNHRYNTKKKKKNKGADKEPTWE